MTNFTPTARPLWQTLRFLLIAALLVAAPLRGQAQEITLNLQDADIRALINTVAEVTGTNFVIDPRVAGKVTVISSQPMGHEALYDVFLSILDVHGFSAVGSGKVIKIIPNVNAKTSGMVAGTSSTPAVGGDIVTEIIEIKNKKTASFFFNNKLIAPETPVKTAAANDAVTHTGIFKK